MKKIDYETHLSTKEYIAAMSKSGPSLGDNKIFDLTTADRVALMDKYEIQTQLISCAGGLETMDLKTATYVAKTANDQMCIRDSHRTMPGSARHNHSHFLT